MVSLRRLDGRRDAAPAQRDDRLKDQDADQGRGLLHVPGYAQVDRLAVVPLGDRLCGRSEADILVVQTQDSAGHAYGNEYLDLYRRVDVSREGRLATWRPNETSGVVMAAL